MEVGRQFDVTRDRIRQIEATAPRKLRHPISTPFVRTERLQDEDSIEYCAMARP